MSLLAMSRGSDCQTHLLGIRAFTNSTLFEYRCSAFRERIFWVALQQEIHSALVRQSSLDINLQVSFLQRPFDLSNEKEWIHYCTLTLARIIMFCFDDRPRVHERHQELKSQIRELAESLPPAFKPYYHSEAGPAGLDTADTFPQIWIADTTAGKICSGPLPPAIRC